ncbi:MAG: hypothetical protein AB2777_16350 [Candidatus Thiodiazotropha endolucinida]
MKYIEKIYNNEYEINLEPFKEEVSELDEYMFNKVEKDKNCLFEKAENYIKEIVDYTKPLFEGGLILNSINISGMSERRYQIEMECYFENDEHMYWSVTYNFPLIKADKDSVNNATYWPIEFKRRVE